MQEAQRPSHPTEDRWPDDEHYRLWPWLLGGLLAAVLLGSVLWYTIRHYVLQVFATFGPATDAGMFGDTFGFVNAIVSGVAMIIVAMTLVLQLVQLHMQATELRQNTKMLGLQRREMEKTNEHFAAQHFEERFFRMLESLEDVVQSTSIEVMSSEIVDNLIQNKTTTLTGRAAFQRFAIELRNEIKPSRSGDESGVLLLAKTRYAYERFYDEYQGHLGHYFRLAYHIAKAVAERAGLSDDDRKQYIQILRAHLSQDEMVLLFYNGLSRYGTKFHRLIEALDLLQNLQPSLLAEERDVMLYQKLHLSLARRKQEDEAAMGVLMQELKANPNTARPRPVP